MHVLLFLTVISLQAIYGFNKLPSYIKPCSRSDPNFIECALKSGTEALPSILEGDPTYHVPSFKPFKLDYVSLEASENIKLYANDVKVHGFEGVEIKELRWDMDNRVAIVRLFFPVLNIAGTYNMNGRILIMNIKGSGPMNNSHYDNDITVKCNYSFKTYKNKEYVQLDNMDIGIKMKRVNLHFGNLLNNTKLSDQMNAFLNENWKILTEEIYPSVNQVLAKIAMSILNGIAAKIPFDDIVNP